MGEPPPLWYFLIKSYVSNKECKWMFQQDSTQQNLHGWSYYETIYFCNIINVNMGKGILFGLIIVVSYSIRLVYDRYWEFSDSFGLNNFILTVNQMIVSHLQLWEFKREYLPIYCYHLLYFDRKPNTLLMWKYNFVSLYVVGNVLGNWRINIELLYGDSKSLNMFKSIDNIYIFVSF